MTCPLIFAAVTDPAFAQFISQRAPLRAAAKGAGIPSLPAPTSFRVNSHAAAYHTKKPARGVQLAPASRLGAAQGANLNGGAL
jgi:hypothetical protein